MPSWGRFVRLELIVKYHYSPACLLNSTLVLAPLTSMKVLTYSFNGVDPQTSVFKMWKLVHASMFLMSQTNVIFARGIRSLTQAIICCSSFLANWVHRTWMSGSLNKLLTNDRVFSRNTVQKLALILFHLSLLTVKWSKFFSRFLPWHLVTKTYKARLLKLTSNKTPRLFVRA
jgi:hypothetical protein